MNALWRKHLRENGIEGKDALGNTIARASVIGNVDERHVTQFTEFVWLIRREAIAMKRDKMFLVARFMQATIMSLLIGVIFLNVGERNPQEPVVSEIQYSFVCSVSLHFIYLPLLLPT